MDPVDELALLRKAIRMTATQWEADPTWFACSPRSLTELLDGDLAAIVQRLERNAVDDYVLNSGSAV